MVYSDKVEERNYTRKKYLCVSVGIVWYPGTEASPSVSQCLLASSGLAVFLLRQNTRMPRDRYTPDLPGLHRIHPIPNNHFLGLFPDVRRNRLNI